LDNMKILPFVMLLAGCSASVEAPRTHLSALGPLAPRSRVVLITLDGVRWQDVLGADARARLPHLYAIADRGLIRGGADFGPSGPNFVSLPGYREIATGHRSDDCHDNLCGPVHEATLLDELRAAGLPPEQVAAIGSWERLDRAVANDASALAVSVGRTHGTSRSRIGVSGTARALLEAGARMGTWPGDGDYRPDAITGPLALEYARVVRPRFLWVALGDTDEHAHHGDYAKYLDALTHADTLIGELMRYTDEETLVLVTTDHGRSANFRDHGFSRESGAGWLIAAGPGLRGQDPPQHLADLAPLARRALALTNDAIATR
jgi:hypothetical protein